MFFKHYRYGIAIGLLIVISILLGMYTFVSGPKISRVEYDNKLSPKNLTLQINMRLDESVQPYISVSPEAEFEYAQNNRTLALRFIEPLLSDTTYTVRLEGLTDSRGKSSSVEHSFTTAPNSIVFIKRSDNGKDSLVEKQIGEETSTIYEAETILDFVHGKNSLLVVEEINGEARLVSVLPTAKKVAGPSGTIRSIFGSTFGDIYILSYVRDDNRSTETQIYNAEANTFEPLRDINGNPIEILEATVAADGETILYRDKNDFTLYVDNLYDQQPALPLGVISNINRYFPDNSGIAIERPERNPGLVSVIETFSGNVTDVDLGLSTSLSTIAMDLTAYAVQVDFTGDSLASDIIRIDEKTTDTFFTPSSESRLHAIDSSLNDELLSIESSPNPVVYDNYSLNSQPRNSMIMILNKEGVVIDEVVGSSVQWRFVD